MNKLFALQWSSLALITIGLWLLQGRSDGLSALLAGLVAIIPTFAFSKLAFRVKGARNAKKIVNHFYLGEAIKIISSMVLFALIFKFYRVEPLVFFATYVVTAMCSWFLLLMTGHQQQ